MPRAAFLSLALLVLGGRAPLQAGEREERIVAVLQRRSPETRTRAELALELARLGPELLPLWRHWLAGEGIEAVFLARGEHRPGDWAVPPEAAGELALEVLAALPTTEVLAELEHGILRDGPGPNEYLTVFRVLERLGSARGLPLYWRMVERLEGDVTELPRFRTAADAALAAMLARDPQVWAPLAKRLERGEPVELELFLSAAFAAGRHEAHGLLLELLDGQALDTLRLEGLRTLARLEREHPWRFQAELVERVQRDWLRLSPEERIEALGLLGASEDPQAFVPLQRHLADSDPLLHSNARLALATLTGIDLGEDLAAWERWEEREQAWWSEELEPTLAALELGPETAAASLAELAAHPFFRRELARAVGSRLDPLEPAVQSLAASFLAGLRTRAALPALLRLASRSQDPELLVRLEGMLTALGARAVGVRRPEAGPALESP